MSDKQSTTLGLPANHAACSSGAKRKPELLAPAGDWECARAAIENGADAIYFGLDRFNARMRAHNFTASDLPELMAFLHARGVKGYVTFNTLVFSDEIPRAIEYLRMIIGVGVDAAIVQDPGICRIIRALSPDFPIHASTQMTVTSKTGIDFARRLGCNLVVLARECSLSEIEHMCGALSPLLPLEVFVHGALCVAYSGQCLTSESLGGRSANRGECAQACRMPYELVSDGKTVPLGDRRYLLSPQDLAGLDLIPDLQRAGVSSFKIEGRLKSPEYVASITRVYRQAIDALPTEPEKLPETPPPRNPESSHRYDMEMAFSRGLYTGWLEGNDNQKLVHARFGKKRGVFIGEVISVEAAYLTLLLTHPLKPGDGVVFDAGLPDQPEEGGRVYEIRNSKRGKKANGEEVEVSFGHGDIQFSRICPGHKVWKTSDPAWDHRVRQTFAGGRPRHRRPVTMTTGGRAGENFVLTVHDDEGNSIQLQSSQSLAKALRHPLNTEKLKEQLGRLGETPFYLQNLDNQLEGEVMLPVSELNRMRRAAIDQLTEYRRTPKKWEFRKAKEITLPLPVKADCPTSKTDRIGAIQSSEPLIVPLVRNLDQLQAALDWGAMQVYCDFVDVKKYREAVAAFRSHTSFTKTSGQSSAAVYVAPPRIFKTGEEWILRQVQSAEADGYLVRNYDHLAFFKDKPCIGDFSLNVANEWTAAWFVQECDLAIVTASYDLNMEQLESLLRAAPAHWFEVTIHQHMPMFHMEHCVFCAFLSAGKNYKDCGRPCDRHDVRLRDRVGAEHPLKADVGCRNTVYNARAQTGAEFVPRMLELGVRRLRIEFLNESPQEVATHLDHYRALVRGELSGSQLWRMLKLVNQLGVTRGQMDRSERFF